MFAQNEINFIKEKVFSIVSFEYKGEISVAQGDGIVIKANKERAEFICKDLSQLARCFFLLALNISEGKENIEIIQKPKFERLGVMLSVQRTMKPEAVVKYMETMSALGFNYILLYMETAYEVEGYPFMGYMRGRYTKEDLKFIDDEGTKLGIEVIPCIQTFGHMSDYLRWGAATPVKDTASCLLADSEETYKFIEAMISTMRGIFRTNRIHIGFDETSGMGFGRYLLNHDYPDKEELFCLHLKKVKAICDKYGVQPLMWSDMPFRLGIDVANDEYDTRSVIAPEITEATSGIDMCFWDYYKYTYESYDNTIKRHYKYFCNSKTVFSGGVWVLDNFIMNMPHTLKATIPAMLACIDNGINDVNATIWGSAENTNLEQSLPGLAAFSEFCYLGKECTTDDIYRASEFATGLTRTYIEAISEFHLGLPNSFKLGARLVWCDVLYELMKYNIDYKDAYERLSKALDIIKAEKNDNEICPKVYAESLFEIAIIKSDILMNLRSAYKNGDKKFLDKVANEYIDALVPLYEKMSEIREKLWTMGTRTFGIEYIQIQDAGMIARLKFAKKLINQYLSGEIDRIMELEQEILDEGNLDWLGDDAHIFA